MLAGAGDFRRSVGPGRLLCRLCEHGCAVLGSNNPHRVVFGGVPGTSHQLLCKMHCNPLAPTASAGRYQKCGGSAYIDKHSRGPIGQMARAKRSCVSELSFACELLTRARPVLGAERAGPGCLKTENTV